MGAGAWVTFTPSTGSKGSGADRAKAVSVSSAARLGVAGAWLIFTGLGAMASSSSVGDPSVSPAATLSGFGMKRTSAGWAAQAAKPEPAQRTASAATPPDLRARLMPLCFNMATLSTRGCSDFEGQ